MNGLLGIIIPESTAVTNLCTNPSFESGTTGWTKGGTNTIAQSAVQQRRGVYSLKCTYANNDVLASYAITLTDTDHVASVDVYIPSDYEGTELTLTWTGFTSATVVAGKPDMTIRDKWQRVHCHINPDSGDLAGTLTLSETGTNGDATEFIYLDGVLIVALDHDVTYIDGTQADCYWMGQDHASTSVRLANSREGGRLVDLEDYNFYLEAFIGSGMAGVSPLLQDSGILPGAIDAGEKITARTMSVVGTVKGTSQNNLHVNRQSIIDAIKSDRVKNRQQFWMVYEGANSTQPTRIKCKYAGGMTTNEQIGFTEKLGIQLVSTDPFWYEDGEQGAVLDTNTELADADYIVYRDSDGIWHSMAGVTGAVRAIAQHPITKEIYIGGHGLNIGGDPDTDHLAKWNGSTWVSVIAGITGAVYALKFDSSGNLYIGGVFTNLGDANGDFIVMWDGSSLHSLGTGLNHFCYSIEIDSNGNVYAGGLFTLAGGVANTAYIAKWDGSVWTPLSTGLNGDCFDIALDNNNNLFAVGNFTTAGVITGCGHVAKWDGSNWSKLNSGSDYYIQNCVVDKNGNLYVGGTSLSFSGVLANRFAKWNGQKWEALGEGVNDWVYFVNIFNEKIYLSGKFTTAGNLTLADRAAIWNGSTYAHLDIDLPGTPIVYALFIDEQDNLYLGYTTAGTAYSGAVNTVTNNGTTNAYPKVTFKRSGGTSATVAYLKNETTGATIWLNYPLQNGETLTLDFNLTKREVISSSRGNVVGTALLRNSDFSDFYLLPGENKINAYVIEAGSPTVTALMNWKITHWSADGSA